MAVMANQPIVSPFIRFYLNALGNELIAEAIDTSKEWAVNITGAGNATTFTKTPTNAPAGYKLNCDVFFEKNFKTNNFEKVATREIAHREDGSDVYVNISEILTPECFLSIPENPFSQYSPTTPSVSRNIRRYYVVFTEITSLGIANIYREDIRKVILGGIAHSLYLMSDFFSNPFGQKGLFSNRPIVKNTRIGSPEYLSFFNNRNASTLSLMVGYNTTQNEVMHINAPAFECVTFPVSTVALGIPEGVKYYWVQVLSDGTLVSATRWYIIDNTPYKSVRILAYLNQYGLPETTICTGGVTEKSIIEAENYNSVRGATSAGNVLRFDRQVQGFEKEYTYRTGIINAQEKEALTEVALSPVLYDVTSLHYFALNLVSDKSQTELIRDMDETIYSYEWVVRPRINMGNFSTEAQLQEITTLAEPQFIVVGGTGNTVPSAPEVIEIGGGNTGNGNNGQTTSAYSWEQLTTLSDTDIVLFAKTNANGLLVGFKWLKSGDYLRHIRGIANESESHLDGIGFLDAAGEKQIQYFDVNGDVKYKKE
jgi:hypothetical protein